MQQAGSNSSVSVQSFGTSFAVSPMVGMNETLIIKALVNLYKNDSHVSVGTFQFRPHHDLEYWVKRMGGPLDRFHEHRMHNGSSIGVNIMNMYNGHELCHQQIVSYEERMQSHNSSGRSDRPWKFDFVVATREDSYFFKPINLTEVFAYMRHSQTKAAAAGHSGTCDIVLKDCLNFGGLNMRMQIMTRPAAQLMLGGRFAIYDHLRKANHTVQNPEQMEKLQAHYHQLHTCPVSVEIVPVTAARRLPNDTVCLYHFEVDDCYPTSVEEEVQAITRCEAVELALSGSKGKGLHTHENK
jgi:hypothetical protein